MKVIVNGEVREFEEGTTLSNILDKLFLSDNVMAAAVNMEIVKQQDWLTHVLADGDKLELLDFVGGG